MAAKGDDRIKSATYFAAMVDFGEPGELEVFIDEDQLRALEDKMSERGSLEGSAMATTFNMLRANDLIRSEEHTSELQSLMRISYAVYCLKQKKNKRKYRNTI